MTENTPDDDPTADSTNDEDNSATVDPIRVEYNVVIEYPSDAVDGLGLSPESAKRSVIDHIHREPLEAGEITVKRSLGSLDDSQVHIIKDDETRVWFVVADSPDEAEDRIKNEFHDPHEDVRVFYEGTLNDYDPRDDPDGVTVVL